MDSKEIVSGLIQELRRGTLILLVLSQLKKPKYGYNLIKVLKDNGISLEANTLYPLMRRLETQGLTTSEWDTADDKPRKYYKLTALGAEVLTKTTQQWKEFSQNVNNILEEN